MRFLLHGLAKRGIAIPNELIGRVDRFLYWFDLVCVRQNSDTCITLSYGRTISIRFYVIIDLR